MEPKITLIMGGYEIEPSSLDEANAILDEWQDSMIEDQRLIQEKYNVTDGTAAAIQYLRSRSRWTQEKEDELVSRDKSGNPIPLSTVLQGDF